MLPLDTGRPASFPKAGLQFFKLLDEEAHLRQAGDVHVI
jgi:hypothetical protein